MEISTIYIISQFFIAFSYVFLLLTYYVKTKKKILILNTISTISEAIGFFLLGAFSGCSMILLSFIRNIIIRYNEKKTNTTLQNISFVFLLFSIIIFSIITYDGLYSILPGISGVIYLYSIRQNNIKTYRILGIPVAFCWILYNVFIYSIVGIIGDSCIVIYIMYTLFQNKHTQDKSHF